MFQKSLISEGDAPCPKRGKQSVLVLLFGFFLVLGKQLDRSFCIDSGCSSSIITVVLEDLALKLAAAVVVAEELFSLMLLGAVGMF